MFGLFKSKEEEVVPAVQEVEVSYSVVATEATMSSGERYTVVFQDELRGSEDSGKIYIATPVDMLINSVYSSPSVIEFNNSIVLNTSHMVSLKVLKRQTKTSKYRVLQGGVCFYFEKVEEEPEA